MPSGSEILVILLVIVFLVFSSYFLVDARLQGKAITFNYSKGVKNIVTFVNGSSNVSNMSMTVVKMSTTSTSTTLSIASTTRFLFFNTGNVVATVIKYGNGSVLINCGSDISIVDKLYLNGFSSLNYMIVTNMDREHAGGCARAQMLVPAKNIYDSGSGNGDFYSEYVLVVGSGRKTLEQNTTFNVDGMNGAVLRVSSRDNTLGFGYGSDIFVYADYCDDGCLDSIPKDGLVTMLMLGKSSVTDERLKSIKPHVLIVNGAEQGMVDSAKKDGIMVIDVDKYGAVELDGGGKVVSTSIYKG